MLGIIIKDFYESFCIRKNLFGFIFSYLFLIFVIFGVRNVSGLVLLIVLALPMTSVSPLQYSMEQDEISKFDKKLLTFPLTRKEIVFSKISSTYIFALLSNLVFSLPIVFVYIYCFGVINLSIGLWIFFLGIIMTLVMLPINNIGFFLLGNKKGTILYMIILVIVTLFYIYGNIILKIGNEFMNPSVHIIIISLLVSIILNIIGYYVCVKIYTHKNS